MLYHAKWLVPVSSPSIEDGVVGVEHGRITYVGPAAGAPPGDRVDLGDCALLPGLVNTHTHLELTVMRGWLEDLPFRRWVIRLTKARQEILDRERLLASARVGIAEGLLAGITTYADTCESGVVHQALREMGVRGVMYLEVFGPQPEQARPALKDLASKVSKHAAESEAEHRLVTEAEGDFADALRARSIDVLPRGVSTISLLDRTRVLKARPLLIHCVRVDADDLGRIADHDCSVAHCPASNAKLGHGSADLAAMLDAGIVVGLGTDSVASNNRMDLLDEARLAALFARASHRRYDVIPAATAIDLTTRGGARALGLDTEIGTLEVGKSADLAAFPLDGLHAIPIQDPQSALLYATSGRGAKLVTVNGRELVRNGQLTIDISESVESIRSAAADLANKTGSDAVSH